MSILVNTVFLTVVFFSFSSAQVTSVTSKEIRFHRDADDESTEAAVTEATPGTVDKTTKKAFGGVIGSIKNVIQKLTDKFNIAMDKIKGSIENIKEKVTDSIGVMQNGISNIFDKVIGLFNAQKRSRSLRVVESDKCDEERFEGSQLVINVLPPMLITYVETGTANNQTILEMCAVIIDVGRYAIVYLEQCIITEDNIYKDTAAMLNGACDIIDKCCYDLQFREEILQGILAGIKEKVPCFKKHAAQLEAQNLLSPLLKGHNRKKRSSPNEELFVRDLLSPAMRERKQKKRSTADEIGDVCDTMQKVTRCTKKANNNMVAAAKLKAFEKELEGNVSGIVDRFCDKHKRSMPSVEVTVPTTVTLPSDVTDKKPASTGVLESSVPILCYLSVIVLVV